MKLSICVRGNTLTKLRQNTHGIADSFQCKDNCKNHHGTLQCVSLMNVTQLINQCQQVVSVSSSYEVYLLLFTLTRVRSKVLWMESCLPARISKSSSHVKGSNSSTVSGLVCHSTSKMVLLSQCQNYNNKHCMLVVEILMLLQTKCKSIK